MPSLAKPYSPTLWHTITIGAIGLLSELNETLSIPVTRHPSQATSQRLRQCKIASIEALYQKSVGKVGADPCVCPEKHFGIVADSETLHHDEVLNRSLQIRKELILKVSITKNKKP